MTRDISPDITTLRLLLTEPHSCSYLEGRQATTAFVDPQTTIDTALYSRLSELGFRRSGPYLYTPHCVDCNACVPARIVAEEFRPNRSQRRCWSRNGDVQVEQLESIETQEHYALYDSYISARHAQGDMFPATLQQFRDFLGAPWPSTRFLEMRLAGKLIGCSVCDVLPSGYSAIYTYFDPAEARRSLGTLGVLCQISLARSFSLPHVYLGYWIAECRKMKYKSNFHPLELFRDNRWERA